MPSFLKKYGKDIFLLLSGGGIYIFSVAKFGSGVTDDSINYLSAASSFPNALLKVDGSPYVEWPPLYPVLLSLFKLTGMTAAGFAMAFQGIVFVLNLLLTGRLLQSVLKSNYIHFIALVFLVFSIPLLQSHVFIWSEPVFILLLLINISVLVKYLETEKLIYFISLIFLSMLMSLQRKTGMYFTINFGIILVLYNPNKSLIKKCLFSLVYMFVSVVPFVLWTWRKYQIAGRVFESSYFKMEKITGNFLELLNTLSSWILPNEIPFSIRISLIIISILFIFYLSRHYINLKSIFNNILFKVIFISFAGYLILLPITFVYIQGETIDDRILSPAYILGLVLFFGLIDGILFQLPDNYIAKKGVMMIVIISLCYPVTRTIYHIKKWNTNGTGGYNTITLINSPMIHWLKDYDATLPIRTDNEYILNYYLNYRTNFHREILPTAKAINSDSSLLVCFDPPLNKDRDFNYIGNGKILYKSKEGTVSLIKK